MKTPREYRQMEYVPLMIELVKLLKPQVYVELGIKRGHTISQIAPFVKTAIGVDIAPKGVPPPNVIVVIGSTLDYAKSLEGRKPFIDMLFIDADHECMALNSDLFAFDPYVKPNGIVLLHDTHPVIPELAVEGYCHNAWKVAAMLAGKDRLLEYEIVTLPGPWAGLSILRKLGSHHLTWAPAKYGYEPQYTIQEMEAIREPIGEDIPERILPETKQTDVESEINLPPDIENPEPPKTDRRGMRNRGFRKLLSPTED
jgi:hypothetical protein